MRRSVYVATADSHASELALDIRYGIGLLLDAGDKAAAEKALHQDHLVIDGSDKERTREISSRTTVSRLARYSSKTESSRTRSNLKYATRIRTS